jgi:hypothetical protein
MVQGGAFALPSCATSRFARKLSVNDTHGRAENEPFLTQLRSILNDIEYICQLNLGTEYGIGRAVNEQLRRRNVLHAQPRRYARVRETSVKKPPKCAAGQSAADTHPSDFVLHTVS